ncbi:hypothetical protein GA0115252_111313 [Streptomyces sp. DfronAA-171]|nr:hypothetical protein GA0115252_111313 [Streptomyces sp. DfronAA-171]
MITNSVVPMPKAPMARARSARGMRKEPFKSWISASPGCVR